MEALMKASVGKECMLIYLMSYYVIAVILRLIQTMLLQIRCHERQDFSSHKASKFTKASCSNILLSCCCIISIPPAVIQCFTGTDEDKDPAVKLALKMRAECPAHCQARVCVCVGTASVWEVMSLQYHKHTTKARAVCLRVVRNDRTWIHTTQNSAMALYS